MLGSPLLGSIVDPFVVAGLVDWADIEAFGGVLALFAALAALAATEYMRRTFATQSDLKTERENREIADSHQDTRIHHLSEIVQQYIGKIDLLRDRMHEQDRAREREMAELREELRLGITDLKGSIGRIEDAVNRST